MALRVCAWNIVLVEPDLTGMRIVHARHSYKGTVMLERVARGQRGVTLVELLAVIAIIAVLIGVIAPATTSGKDGAVDAQVLQDAARVRDAASDFYTDQNEAETRSPHTVDMFTKLPTNTGDPEASSTATTFSNLTQEISDRWPEKFITQDESAGLFVGKYDDVFQTVTTAGRVVEVVILDKSDKTIGGDDLMTGYTAVDLDTLVAGNLLLAAPSGTKLESDGIPNFLWLFKKRNSTAGVVDDDRSIAVFKLTKIEEQEIAGQAANLDIKLTYVRIF